MKEPDDEGFSFRNIFYYVDTRTSERLKRTVETPLYVPFRNILQRKVANYTDPATNMRYLIRTYLEEGVDPSSRDNTYLEVFSMDDVYNPWIVKVIDRSFVGSDSMAIADVKIYKGDVYLLDVKKGLYRFDFTRGLDIVVTGHYAADQQLTKLAVYQSTLDGIEYVALANAHAVYEIDWTFPARPKEVAKYSLLNGSLVTSLWLNEDFLVVQATANVTFGTSFMLNNYTWVMNRGDRTYSTAFKVIDHQHWRAFTHFDRRDNRLMVAD